MSIKTLQPTRKNPAWLSFIISAALRAALMAELNGPAGPLGDLFFA